MYQAEDTSANVTTRSGGVINSHITRLGAHQIVWTDGLVNFCFLSIYLLFQVNAVVLVRKLEYQSCAIGICLFGIALVMEFCLLIQPPELMKWIPFWKYSVGRGVVLCFFSIVSMEGYFLVGFIALIASMIVGTARIFIGTYAVSPPVFDYTAIFGHPHVKIPSVDSKGSSPDTKSVQDYSEILELDLI